MSEFVLDDSLVDSFSSGDILSTSFLDGVEEVSVVGVSKGKGYQGIMKRFHAQGGPKTHGSKFHRHVGSLGNRKPRRVQKGHPHAGQMGGDKTTVKGVKILDKVLGDENILVMKGSLPGAYNGLLKLVVS